MENKGFKSTISRPQKFKSIRLQLLKIQKTINVENHLSRSQLIKLKFSFCSKSQNNYKLTSTVDFLFFKM